MRGLLRKAGLPIAVLGLAILAAVVLIATRSEPEKTPRLDRGTLVQTWTAETRQERLTVNAQGVVKPAISVVLQPQVGGQVIEINRALVPGGILPAGEMLFRIDPADYRLAVETARTQLAQAEAELALEQGRGKVAAREWELFEDQRDEEADAALALREPQLRAAVARVEAARARLRQAELDLARTRVTAPFNALVLSENVDLGQTLSPQSQAATLVGTDEAWVRTSVPVDQLAFVRLPQDDGTAGSPARIRLDAGSASAIREGRVIRLLGDLDPAGRLARLLVAIKDPMAVAGGELPLLFDSYVDVEIESDLEAEVVPLQRAWLHSGDRVYVYSPDGKLDIRNVEVGWRKPDTVMITGGLEAGERVVTSPIASALDGMKLRLEDAMPGTVSGNTGQASR